MADNQDNNQPTSRNPEDNQSARNTSQPEPPQPPSQSESDREIVGNAVAKFFEDKFANQATPKAKKPSQEDPDEDPDSRRQDVANGEGNPDGSWQNKTNNPKKKQPFKRRAAKVAKKMGPSVGIIALILGGFGGLSLLLAPTALFAFLDRQMTSDSSDSTRTNFMMRRAYIGGLIGKADCSTKIKCKFSTMGQKQVDKWKAAGFTIEPDTPDSDGRYKVTSVTFPGGSPKVSSSAEFFGHIDSNIEARVAFDRVVNSRSGMFNSKFANWDKVWKKFGLNRSKSPSASTNRDESAREAESRRNYDQHTNAVTDADPDARARAHLDRTMNGENGQPGLKAKLATAANKMKGLKGAVKAADITSFICTGYTIVKITTATIKLKWYKDLIVFGMPFFQIFAKAINQGSLTWQDAEFVGDRLTWYLTAAQKLKSDLYKDYSEEEFNLTAMDSQGIKAMIYGEHSALKEFTKQYMGWWATTAIAGSGIMGQLERVVGGKQNLHNICFASNAVGLVSSAACLTNPISFGVCAAAIAGAYLFADDIIAVIAKEIAQPAMDLIAKAGLNSNLAGVRLGNALAAAIGLMMAEQSRASGLRAATNVSALTGFYLATEDVYQKHTTEIAKYEARQQPFDSTNQYSFISQLASTFFPTLPTQHATVFSGFTQLFSTALTPISYLSPIANAKELHQPTQLGLQAEGRTNMCNPENGPPQDQDLADIGVLCDHVGDTAGYTDPEIIKAAKESAYGDRNVFAEVADSLQQQGCIDEDGRAIGDKNPNGAEGDEEKDGSEYDCVKYENHCGINRTDPPGTTTRDLSTGSEEDKAWWIYARCAGKNYKKENLSGSFLKKLSYIEAHYNGCKTQFPIAEEEVDCTTQPTAATVQGKPCNQGWTYPTDKGATTYTSGFGARWGTQHQGVDLAGPIGTPVYAACDGKVVQAGAASGFGQWVVLEHEIDGQVYGTVYGHVETFLVKEGDTVTAGQQIATIGNRGQSTGPHLHFEIWPNGRFVGRPIDPAPLIGLGSPSSS